MWAPQKFKKNSIHSLKIPTGQVVMTNFNTEQLQHNTNPQNNDKNSQSDTTAPRTCICNNVFNSK